MNIINPIHTALTEILNRKYLKIVIRVLKLDYEKKAVSETRLNLSKRVLTCVTAGGKLVATRLSPYHGPGVPWSLVLSLPPLSLLLLLLSERSRERERDKRRENTTQWTRKI